jgi:hypothetical protein
MLAWLARLERRAFHQEREGSRVADLLQKIDAKLDEQQEATNEHRFDITQQLHSINVRTAVIETRLRLRAHTPQAGT